MQNGGAFAARLAAEVRDVPAARRGVQILIVGAAAEAARLHQASAQLGPLCKAERARLKALRAETAAAEARLAALVRDEAALRARLAALAAS